MRELTDARHAGRALRRKLGLEPEGLYDCLCEYLWDTYQVEPKAVDPKKLRGGRAEVKPPSIFYNRALDADPKKRTRVVAHEAGHLDRHERLHHLDAEPDPVRSGTYLNHERAPSIARYSRKSREETEADAFALEFVCPSDEAFRLWLADPQATSDSIARALGTTKEIVRAQLVEGLYHFDPRAGVRRADADVCGAGVADGPQLVAPVDPPSVNAAGVSERNVTRDVDDERDPQDLAIEHEGGAALVDAGPGCGKTHALIERAARVIRREVEASQEQRRPISPKTAAERVLALTFSNEAAGEIQDRLAKKLGTEAAAAVTAATFHSFCRQLLHVHGDPLGISADAPMLDEAAQEALILDAIGRSDCDPILDLKDLEESASRIRRHIDYLKQRLTDGERELEPWTPRLLRRALDRLEAEGEHDAEVFTYARALLSVFDVYEEMKAEAGMLDFADLIALTIRLLRERPEVARANQLKYRHVLVDEFQDVSRSVGVLLSLLCGPENPPWVVGDPNQAIYRFLAAAPDNIHRFHEVFSDRQVYRLRRNFRAAPEIVAATNELATLLQHLDFDGEQAEERFVAVAGVEALGPEAVRIAQAESDVAEAQGVVRQVEEWIRAGVAPHDVAVLCRRNADVKEIVLALGKRGIRAVSSGVLTPEGAAGDLAALITINDGGASSMRISMARLTYALGRECRSADEIDAVVKDLFHLLDHGGLTTEGRLAIDDAALAGKDSLVREVVEVARRLATETFAADAFDVLTAFLFDASPYLRNILSAFGPAGRPDVELAAERDLGEVVATLHVAESITALSRAAAYRFSHPEGPLDDPAELPKRRRRARLEFAAGLRRALTDATPTAVTPRRTDGAVQVMTCHASKGLEFPCVCVVGQTLGPGSDFPWLPDVLHPADEEDKEQAAALLFVGVTRAKRAVVVSYALSRSTGGRSRKVTPLLERWVERFRQDVLEWREEHVVDNAQQSTTYTYGPVWGRRGHVRLRPRALDAGSCAVEVYIQDMAKMHFPEVETPVYPLYFDALRQVMHLVVIAFHTNGGVTEADIADMLKRVWVEVVVRVPEHRHLPLFQRLVRRHVRAFASVYEHALAAGIPQTSAYRKLNLTLIEATPEPTMRVLPGFVAAFETDDRTPVALLLRTESYAGALAKDGSGINWSGMAARRRLAFVMLQQHYPDLMPLVYSAADGRIYRLNWSTRKGSTLSEQEKAASRLDALVAGVFHARVDDWTCDRCTSRLACPHWIRDGQST